MIPGIPVSPAVHIVAVIDGLACYAGLIAPAEGIGLWQRLFFGQKFTFFKAAFAFLASICLYSSKL